MRTMQLFGSIALALIITGFIAYAAPFALLMIVSFTSFSPLDHTYSYESVNGYGTPIKSTSNYHRDELGNIYYQHNSLGSKKELLSPPADPGSFETLGQNIAKDASHVWTTGSLSAHADAASLEKVAGNFSYFVDARQVYYSDELRRLEWADPKSFEIIASASPSFVGSTYARDLHAVYYAEKRLDGADPGSFEILDWNYARDARQVYIFDRVIPGLNSVSFERLEGDYLRDSDSVYWYGWPVEGADAPSFEALGKSGYARDARSVYYHTGALAYADASKFEFIGAYARDSHAVYYEGRVVSGADPVSFRPCGDRDIPVVTYMCDDHAVYSWGQSMEWVDPDTFVPPER